MTLNQMKDAVIRTFGFEHPATIYFFECCEMDDDLLLCEIAFAFAMGWDNPGAMIDEWLA